MKSLWALLLIVSATACKHDEQEQPRKSKGIPNALQEKSVDVSSLTKREKEDLVEVLYNELTHKDAALKALDDMLTDVAESKTDSLRRFTLYDQNNNTYYATYTKLLQDIKDSVLRKRMNVLLDSSMARYKTLMAGHQKLSDSTIQMYTALADLHWILKLSKTLTVMENYQRENMPDTTTLKNTMQYLQTIKMKADAAIHTDTIPDSSAHK